MSDLLRHPSEKELLLAADGELPEGEARQIEAHLKTCWTCRGLRHDMEAAIAMFVSLHGAVLESRIPPNEPSRALLTARLSLRYSREAGLPRSWWSRLRLIPSRVAAPDAPLFLPRAMALGLAAAMALLLVLWHTSGISANDLLARAASSETQTAKKKIESGVVYQKFHIRTAKRTLEHSVYSDAEGRRQPRHQALSADDARLEARLALAGVTWERPLSALSYKHWHDLQAAPKDEVRPTGSDLTVITTVPSGAVVQESLTVRMSDLHPIERTVAFRDEGNVEITEVSYKVMSWGSIGDGIFEPFSEPMHSSPLRSGLIVLTRAEIDEAELQTRLILNHLNADTGERIEIVRKPSGIEVKGIVETDERKWQLLESLQPLPHVASSIFSFQDIKSRPASASDITSIKAYSIVAQPSPLDTYLTEKGLQPDEISQLHQQVLSASIAIHQESTAIAELVQRFETAALATSTARSALNELVSDHKAKLIAALDEELQLIDRIDLPTGTLDAGLPTSASPDAVNLRRIAERNFSLCTQLISGSDAPLPVQSLISELAESAAQLRAIATTLHLPAHLPGYQPSAKND